MVDLTLEQEKEYKETFISICEYFNRKVADYIWERGLDDLIDETILKWKTEIEKQAKKWNVDFDDLTIEYLQDLQSSMSFGAYIENTDL